MKKRIVALLMVLCMCTGLAACAGKKDEKKSKESSGEEIVVSIATLNNPIVSNLVKLAQEYYDEKGVKLDFAVLPENDLREKATLEASTGGTTYDIYFTGPYEANFWITYGWAENLQPYIDKMSEEQKESLDLDDIFPSMLDSLSDPETGDVYALPFFGEASFFMYNKELLDNAGVSMPENPTWEDIYDIAVAVDDEEAGITGMTMRGAPGWGHERSSFCHHHQCHGRKVL